MIKLTTAALFFLAAGIFTSVTILSAYQILFALPLIWYTYLAVKEKNFKLPTSAWFLLAFAAVAIISLVINIDLVPKPSKNFGRIKYFLFGVCGIFVLRTWLVDASDKAKRFVANVFLFSMIVAGSAALWNFFTIDLTKFRVKGLTDTMRYGYGTAMVLLMLISALLHREKIKNWFDPRMGLAALVFALIGMYLTNTRGAMLGFFCGLPVVLYYYRPKVGLAFGTISLIVVATLGSFYLFGNINQGQSSRYLMNKNNSGDVIRRSQWNAAVIAIKESPVIGWGFSNFHSQLKRIKNQYDLDAKDYDDAHSHNLFLEMAAGTGLIGLFFFLAWLVTWAAEAFKSKGLVRTFIIPFGVCFVVSSQFEVTFDANNASMIFFLYSISSVGKKNV